MALADEIEKLAGQFGAEGADLRGLTKASGPLVTAAGTFFDDILVMAEDEKVKAARLGLLASLVALAPAGIDWRALDIALD